MKIVNLPLASLRAAPWNANRVALDTMEKIRESIRRYGIVENLVVRAIGRDAGKPKLAPLSKVSAGPIVYEVISGNHRLELYAEEGMKTAPCYVVELDDAHARLLAQTLNRTRGEDDPEAYAQLLRDVLADLPQEDVLAVLPETKESIESILGPAKEGHGPGDPEDDFNSQYGVIVVCDNESSQQEVYEDLTAHGYECRVVVT